MDLGGLAGLVFPGDPALRRHLQRASRVAEKIVPVGQRPAILRMYARMPPEDFAYRGDRAHRAGIGIGAEEGMPRTSRHCKDKGEGERGKYLEYFHGIGFESTANQNWSFPFSPWWPATSNSYGIEDFGPRI